MFLLLLFFVLLVLCGPECLVVQLLLHGGEKLQ